MNGNKKRLKFKGIDILSSTEQDLKSWQSTIQLLFQRDDVESALEAKTWDLTTSDEEKQKWKKASATVELLIMQHTGGEVQVELMRRLAVLRGEKGGTDAYQAWNVINDIFKGAGSTNKHLWLTKLFDFKMQQPATRQNIIDGLNEFETIHSKLSELNVNMEDDILGIKLASALPREDTSCKIVYTNTMQKKTPTVSSVKDDIRHLINQFVCEENDHEKEEALYGSEINNVQRKQKNNTNWCGICRKNGYHKETDCWFNKQNQNPKHKGSKMERMVRELVEKALKEKSRKPAKLRQTELNSDSEENYLMESDSDNSSEFDYSKCSSTYDTSGKQNHNRDTWLLDSGATSHMTNSGTYMYHLKPIKDRMVKIGNGKYIQISHQGSLNVLNKQGKTIVLTEVYLVPELTYSLISISKLQRNNLSTKFPGGSTKHVFIKNKHGRRTLSAIAKGKLYEMEMTRTKKKQTGTIHEFAATSMEMWHQRFGHISPNKIKQMKEMLKKQNLTLSNENGDIKPCTACCKTKIKRRSKIRGRKHKATKLLEVTHTDVAGPWKKSKGGNRYMCIFLDEKSRKGTSYMMKRKSDALKKFKQYMNLVENEKTSTLRKVSMSHKCRQKLMRLQTDGGGEYTSNEFEEYLKSKGIQHYVTNADEPRQNGMAERQIRSIIECGMAMLRHSNLGNEYWPYAMRMATYVLNRIPKTILGNKSPYEIWHNEQPDLRNIRIFGCEAYVRIKENLVTKGNDKGQLCTFLGYQDGLKGYIFENKRTGRIIKSGDAIFYEGNWLMEGVQKWGNIPSSKRITPFEKISDLEMPDDLSSEGSTLGDCAPDSISGDEMQECEHNARPISDSENQISNLSPALDSCAQQTSQIDSLPDPKTTSRSSSTRDRRENTNYERNYNNQQAHISTTKREGTDLEAPTIPTNIKEAKESRQWKEWKDAIKEEMHSLHENSVFSPSNENIPSGRKPVTTRWIFTIKRNEKGKIERYKARLVARGFTQREGIDYDKTFAPVMKQTLLRTILAKSNQRNWEIQQIDIKTAFLYGSIDEEIWVKLPNGSIRKLQRALYGLKQAGRQWYGRFHKSLEQFGLKRIDGDPCCYMLNDSDIKLIVLIHVDDAIIVGNSKSMINKLKDNLRTEYKIKDLGDIKHCLGWEITRDRQNGILKICQQQYIRETMKKFGIEDRHQSHTPASEITLSKRMQPKQCDKRLNKPYLELLGAVLYIATCTRPDTSYAVSELSRYSSNPGKLHWKELKKVLMYLNATQSKGLVYKSSESGIVNGFVDASFARCVDTRKSRYGVVFIHSGCAIDWKSKMQAVVAMSSMEAEYIGMAEAAKMAAWLNVCMVQLGIFVQDTIKIGVDNLSAKLIAEEAMVKERSKHIDLRYHYIRQQIKNGSISLEYIPSEQMPADTLTKPLPRKQFNKCRNRMGIQDMDIVPDKELEGSVKDNPSLG